MERPSLVVLKRIGKKSPNNALKHDGLACGQPLHDGKTHTSITIGGLDDIINWLQLQHSDVQRHYLRAKKKLNVS